MAPDRHALSEYQGFAIVEREHQLLKGYNKKVTLFTIVWVQDCLLVCFLSSMKAIW